MPENIIKHAALFPGQGSQHIGMAQSFAAHKTTRHLFTQANDILGFDITALMTSGDEEILRQTENAQPALLLAGIAAWTYQQATNPIMPTVFAGHSLGEYTALVAAGVISFEAGLTLVRQRGAFMAAAMPSGEGGMSAVLGLSIDKIQPVAAAHGVFVANDNAEGQVILSGNKQKLEAAAPDIKAAGAKRVLPLPVAGAFHTPLMQSAADKMAKILATVEFQTPSAPIILNTTAEPTLNPLKIKENLPLQITSPVRWRETMIALDELEMTKAYEYGAGNVLSNLIKRSGSNIGATAVTAVTP